MEKDNESEETIAHLEKQIFNLKQQYEVINGKDIEISELRNQLSGAEKSRMDLSLCLKESSRRILSEAKDSEEFKADIIAKNEKLIAENNSLKGKLNKVMNEKFGLDLQLKEVKKHTLVLDSDFTIMHANLTNEDAMAKLLNDLNNLLRESNQTNSSV